MLENRFDSLLPKSQRSGWIATAVSGVLYLLVMAALYPRVGGQLSALVILPALISAWMLGLRVGLLNALLLTILNFFIFLAFERDAAVALRFTLGAGSLSVFVVAAIVGALRHLLERVQKQSRLLDEERAALRQEINERAKAEAELAEMNAELDEFAYVISHDLKAPLRAIANLSEWIEEDLGEDLPPAVVQNMALLRQRVDHMRTMIDGVLAYSRAGRRTTSIEQVAVSEAARQAAFLFDCPPGFVIAIAPDMPTVRAERIKLEQVFGNLISNALKYHDRPDGCITVSYTDDGAHWRFTVADDGPGIEPAYQDKIFDLFQAANPTKESDSTGIGLAVVKKIVREQGGRVWVDSVPGNGAAFHFTWPKALAPVGF